MHIMCTMKRSSIQKKLQFLFPLCLKWKMHVTFFFFRMHHEDFGCLGILDCECLQWYFVYGFLLHTCSLLESVSNMWDIEHNTCTFVYEKTRNIFNNGLFIFLSMELVPRLEHSTMNSRITKMGTKQLPLQYPATQLTHPAVLLFGVHYHQHECILWPSLLHQPT